MDMNMVMWVAPALLGLIGFLLLVVGLRRIFGGQVLGGGARTLGGALFLSLAAVFGLLALNILTYTRLSKETEIATVSFKNADGADPTAFIATVTRADGGGVTDAPIQGNRWRMEARQVIWKPWANILGLDSHARLERIAGDWESVADVNSRVGSAANLYTDPMGLDMMAIIKGAGWLPAFDLYQGSAVYMPMVKGAEFKVLLPNRGGLIARPNNDIAREAVQNWQVAGAAGTAAPQIAPVQATPATTPTPPVQ
jgi:hypothetical protein